MGRAALALLVAGGAWLSAFAGADCVSVGWTGSGEPGRDVLALVFEGAPGAASVELTPAGAVLELQSVPRCASEVPGVRIESATGGGTRLVVERPDATLIGVRWSANAVALTFRIDAARDPSTYHLGVGDVVGVSVYKNPDLSGDYTVAQDGSITLPLLGDVPAAGLTQADLARKLTEDLGRDLLVDPQVSVTVKTYKSQYVYVTGAVARSSRIAVQPGMTLKDVLSEAGVALEPGQELIMNRPSEGGERIRLEASQLDDESAPVPRDGDVLTIQEVHYYYMQGEVRRPSRYNLRAGTTLLEAISIAEGLTDWANRKQIRILRKTDGKPSEIVVNLNKVESLQLEDPEIRPGDVIIVRRRLF